MCANSSAPAPRSEPRGMPRSLHSCVGALRVQEAVGHGPHGAELAEHNVGGEWVEFEDQFHAAAAVARRCRPADVPDHRRTPITHFDLLPPKIIHGAQMRFAYCGSV